MMTAVYKHQQLAVNILNSVNTTHTVVVCNKGQEKGQIRSTYRIACSQHTCGCRPVQNTDQYQPQSKQKKENF